MHAPTARRALAAGALATILVAPLSGCQSGDDDASPGPPASPSVSASPSEPETTEPAPTTSPSGTASPTSTPTPSETGGTDTPSPTNAVEYADALVIAWGAGEQERLAELATPEVIETLTGHADPGGPHWDRTGADSGAGSSFVRYENTEDGTTLELRVENEAAARGQEQAVAEAKFG